MAGCRIQREDSMCRQFSIVKIGLIARGLKGVRAIQTKFEDSHNLLNIDIIKYCRKLKSIVHTKVNGDTKRTDSTTIADTLLRPIRIPVLVVDLSPPLSH
jgi:hypothetical protein